MTNAIELKKLTKFYNMKGNVVRALDGIDLVIPSGIMASIVGSSGSGKTTLINMIGGLDRPSGGEVILYGQPIHNISERGLIPHRRKLLGYVFQSYNLIPNLSAIENVELPLEFARFPAKKRRQRAIECLQLAELPASRYNHRPAQLSGGEQQRVAIARALANDPKILLTDEPTGNLDSKTGKQIVDLLKRLAEKEGKTVIVISHDREVSEAATMTAYISDGQITHIVNR
ncbi:MAG: ABC transporter ATP-binding protein [bacterium]|nr:ABC transporter ATP-binding protein [bacterium]